MNGLGRIVSRLAARSVLAGLVLAPAFAVSAEDGLQLDVKPIKFGAAQEFGTMYNSFLISTNKETPHDWIDHFSTYFIQQVIVEGKLDLKAGLGGIFQFAKPEYANEEFGGSQSKMFFAGPPIAEAMYHFGGVEGSTFSLGGGMFPYKYNPDARLGEYLFRSIPYPTALFTGASCGFTVMGFEPACLEGFRASTRLGGFSADLLLTTETNIAPLYDWSLGLVAAYSIADGLIDIGAGVNFRKLISIDKKKTDVKARQNSYFQKGGEWYSGNFLYYREPANFYAQLRDSATARGQTEIAAAYGRRVDSLNAIADSLDPAAVGGGAWLNADGLVPGASYFSTGGTLLMGRINMDLKKLFSSEVFSKEDLRVYAEAAVVGLKTYDVYYTKLTERLPLMVGVNLPTFGLLDIFSIQYEYFNSPHLNNIEPLAANTWATPYFPSGTDPAFSTNEYNDLTTRDNHSWSILMRKTLVHGFTLGAQFARDHYRTVGKDWFYGSRLDPNEILYESAPPWDPKSWYWMVQAAWNI